MAAPLSTVPKPSAYQSPVPPPPSLAAMTADDSVPVVAGGTSVPLCGLSATGWGAPHGVPVETTPPLADVAGQIEARLSALPSIASSIAPPAQFALPQIDERPTRAPMAQAAATQSLLTPAVKKRRRFSFGGK